MYIVTPLMAAETVFLSTTSGVNTQVPYRVFLDRGLQKSPTNRNLPWVGGNMKGVLTFGSKKGGILVVCDGSGGHGCQFSCYLRAV